MNEQQAINEAISHHDKRVQIEIQRLHEEFDISEIKKEKGYSEE